LPLSTPLSCADAVSEKMKIASNVSVLLFMFIETDLSLLELIF
jgi:hypothetical protein